jgi:YHS domain-containing protein
MEFRNLLSTICYECELFKYDGCRTCIPSNNRLFHDDPALDIKLSDNCEIKIESDVEALPLNYEGKTYYYAKNENEYIFYSFDDALGAFTPLHELDDLNQILKNLIN